MSRKKCVIIGASPLISPDIIRENIKSGDFVVCADGGCQASAAAGIVPQLVIGDFDSCIQPDADQLPSVCEVIQLPREKDDTDTMYCVRTCIDRGYGEFVLLGMTGGRCDHTYANFCVLLYLAQRGCSAVMKDAYTEIRAAVEGSVLYFDPTGKLLSGDQGTFARESDSVPEDKENSGRREDMSGVKFSVFPFGCEECEVTLRGFQYELERGVLRSEFPLGISNEFTSGKAEVYVHRGSALLMVTRENLGEALCTVVSESEYLHSMIT